MQPVTLLFDLAVLGYGYIQPVSKTGIYRVTENLFLHFISNTALNIGYYASTENYYESYLYLRQYFTLDTPKILNKPKTNKLTDNFNILRVELNHTLNYSTHSIQILLLKLIRPIIKLFANTLTHLFKSNNSEDSISQYQIYHSLFYPIPKSLAQNDQLKKVITIHDIIPIKFPQYCFDFQTNIMDKILESITNNTYIICDSLSTKNDLLEYRGDIDKDKVFVNYPAASDNFKACTDKNLLRNVRNVYNIPTNCKYVLSLATLEPRKNLSFLIKNFLAFIEDLQCTDLYLVLVGTKGWKYDEIFKGSKLNKELTKYLIFTGFVPDEDLAPLYSQALVFAYPSLYEGFGLPPLEAMKCGTPVITSNISSLPEVVSDAGLLIDPKSDDEMQDAIKRFYLDKHYREKKAHACLARSKIFTWEAFANKTIEIYQQILSNDK